jgi:hypothetical protein
MWCTIINGGILLLWTTFFLFAPDLLYRTQKRWFSSSRENFDIVMYAFLGLFKVFFLVFNLVPFLSLLIIT